MVCARVQPSPRAQSQIHAIMAVIGLPQASMGMIWRLSDLTPDGRPSSRSKPKRRKCTTTTWARKARRSSPSPSPGVASFLSPLSISQSVSSALSCSDCLCHRPPEPVQLWLVLCALHAFKLSCMSFTALLSPLLPVSTAQSISYLQCSTPFQSHSWLSHLDPHNACIYSAASSPAAFIHHERPTLILSSQPRLHHSVPSLSRNCLDILSLPPSPISGPH